MILDQIVSTIANNVASGLAGQVKFDYPLEQLENDVWNERLSVLNEWLRKGGATPAAWAQQVEVNVLNERINPPLTPIGSRTDTAIHFRLPVPAASFQEASVISIGASEHARGWKPYMDDAWRYHAQRRATAGTPFVWLNMASRLRENELEYIDAYLFNCKTRVTKVVARAVYELAGQASALVAPEQPFPAPGEAIQLLITTLSERYLRYYQRGHGFYNYPIMNMPGVQGGTLPFTQQAQQPTEQ